MQPYHSSPSIHAAHPTFHYILCILNQLQVAVLLQLHSVESDTSAGSASHFELFQQQAGGQGNTTTQYATRWSNTNTCAGITLSGG